MELLGLGFAGWVAALIGGFVVGGIYFLSIKAQVDYVHRRGGPLWVAPALLYARILFVGVILVLLASLLPRRTLAAVCLAGVGGTIAARVLITRMVRGRGGVQAEGSGEQ